MKRLMTGIAVGILGLGIAVTGGSRQALATNVNFSNVWVGTVTPGAGHIGVDIWWGGSQYNPCHNSGDIYYGACVMSNSGQKSYYKVASYTSGGSDFPSGIFIDNQNPNYCTSASWCTNPSAQTINHGWANLVSGAALEIYPHISDTNNTYDPSVTTVGGVRVQVDSFPTFANGGRYSANVGNISLPQIGQSGVGRLNGFITENGVTVPANRVAFDVFQNGSTRTTSNGYPVAGFSSVRNNGDGYYNTGALPTGSYKIYVSKLDANGNTLRKIILDPVSINSAGERLDFQLEQNCFGRSSCTVEQ